MCTVSLSDGNLSLWTMISSGKICVLCNTVHANRPAGSQCSHPSYETYIRLDDRGQRQQQHSQQQCSSTIARTQERKRPPSFVTVTYYHDSLLTSIDQSSNHALHHSHRRRRPRCSSDQCSQCDHGHQTRRFRHESPNLLHHRWVLLWRGQRVRCGAELGHPYPRCE